MKTFPQNRHNGFTMIEVMLALGLIGILVAGIFQTQRAAVNVSNDVIETQERSMRSNAMLDLLRRTFELIPGNCRVNLIVPRGRDGTSDLVFKDYPMAFSWSGVSAGSKSVIFRTERARGAGFNIVVLYLDEESTKAYENGNFQENEIDHVTRQPRVRKLLLMEGIRTLIWSIQDEQKQEWVYEWPFENNRRPSLFRLEMEAMEGSEPTRVMFWIPVVVQPQQFANASMTGGSGGNGGGGSGGPGNPGGPGGPINLTPPPTSRGPGGVGGGGPKK